MPRYSYRCRQGHLFEQQRSILERDVEAPCPECAEVAHRVPGAPGIAFRGPGFYATDYKGKR